MIDPRFIKESGPEVFTGNELLLKGALETEGGVHLLTGYPGSPISGFFDAMESIGPLLCDKGIVAKLANNEALSVAMVNGAQMAGCRAIAAFKSVGMHVASDALALGVLAGTQGDSGGVFIIGDDPWSDSTQVPADSRFLAEHVRLPIIEPSSPQEIKDWINLAFKLGQAGQIYIGLSMTTNLADGGGSVICRPNAYPLYNENHKKTLNYERDIEPRLEQAVLLPPRTWRREIGLETRFQAVKAEARRVGVNRILCRPVKDVVAPLGFVAAGHAYAYLAHALSDMGLTNRFPILKLGMYYPLDETLVLELARICRRIVVIEERRGFVERQVLEALAGARQAGELQVEIYGKQFPKPLAGIPATRGLNPSILVERLTPLMLEGLSSPASAAFLPPNAAETMTRELARIQETAGYQVNFPDRTPAFCPGCPHRDSSNVLLELRRDFRDPQYMLAYHKRKPLDLVCHGDTGCYTMLMFEPNKTLMHNYSGMGLGGATGSGVDPFIDNKQLVFMGDGTFFHSGQIAISHSIQTGQDITYIILENKTTAMTGHQTHAGLDYDLRGLPAVAQDIERIVLGQIPRKLARDVRVVRINPADRTRYRRLLEQTILASGVKVIIADKECGITSQRRIRSQERREARETGFLPRKTYMNVATEVCEHCLECTNQTGCPGLTIADTDYGPKIQTDLSWCVNDGACQRIDACPSFEEVTVLRRQPPRLADEHFDLSDIPEPPRPIHADQDQWRCYLAGVGGMGIGLCTAILTTAGHYMGYHVQFLDKKGLAIRNGGVFSQLVYSRPLAGNGAGEDPAAPADLKNPKPDIRNEVSEASYATPLVTYGKADLLLGVDLLEATRAIDPRHPYRVASPQRTCAVVNTAKTPTILTLMGRDDFHPDELEEALRRYTHPERYFGFDVGHLCERVLDTKLYANIMMLGIAWQKGFLPLTQAAMEHAIRQVISHEVERNLRAFAIGRKIAVRPDLFTVELKHEYETARQTMRRKFNTLRLTYRGRRGKVVAKQFRVLLKQTFRASRGSHLPDSLFRDVIIRAYDCLTWGGVEYARLYCKRLVEVFHKDHADYNYALTRAAVWNLARVMLIKDEVYVSALLTSPEKYKRDRRRFNANPANGDRIVYRHYNRPEFQIGKHRIRFNFRSRDWQLRLMSRLSVLRKVLPAWHRREKAFRDWYIGVVDQVPDHATARTASGDSRRAQRDYQRWLAILSTPETATGYREVRYPRMEAARRRAEELLAMDPELFEPPFSPPRTPPAAAPPAVTPSANGLSLPVLPASQPAHV